MIDGDQSLYRDQNLRDEFTNKGICARVKLFFLPIHE